MGEELIKLKLFQAVMDCLSISREIKLTDNLVDDLGADDLDIIYLVMDLEEEFGVEITEASVENCFTVGDLFRVLRESVSKLSSKKEIS